MPTIEPEVLDRLSPAEAEQLETFRVSSKNFETIGIAHATAPDEHKSRWQRLLEQTRDELKANTATSRELKRLFVGVLAVEEYADEGHLQRLRDSLEHLKAFETDESWLEQETDRVTLLERVTPVRTLLLPDAHRFMSFLGERDGTQETEVRRRVAIDPEGLFIDDEILLWERMYDPSQRGRSPLSKEEIVGRSYHTAGLIAGSECFQTESGLEIAPTALVVRTILADPVLRKLFTKDQSKSEPYMQARNGFDRSVRRINEMLRRSSGSPKLFNDIRRDQSAPYGIGYSLNNDAYQVSFSEEAKDYNERKNR